MLDVVVEDGAAFREQLAGKGLPGRDDEGRLEGGEALTELWVVKE